MTETSKEQTITWGDIHTQLNKLSVAALNVQRLIKGDFALNSDESWTTKEVYSLIELEEHLVGPSKPAGLNNRIAFKNLLFIQVGENFWTVHHKNNDGEIKHFETIDFTIFAEVHHFPALIEEMLKGPEHYWGVNEYKEVREGFVFRLIKGYLEGTLKPIQEEENHSWINHEGRVVNSTDPTMSREDAECLEMTPTLKYQDTVYYEHFEGDFGVPYAPERYIDSLQTSLLSGLWSNVQRFGYRNLVFCEMTDSGIWAVYHHNGDGNLRHFVNIDFVPFAEHGIFHHLIKGMDKGPEYFWNVDKFEKMPVSKADRILLDLANLSSEERQETIDLELLSRYEGNPTNNNLEPVKLPSEDEKSQRLKKLENKIEGIEEMMKELRKMVAQS